MSAAIATALVSRLTAGTALTALGCTGVYYAVAPQGAAYPYVTVQLTDGTDSRTFGRRATVREGWAVQAWDQGASHKRAKQIAEAADALLDEWPLAYTGGTVMACRRLGELPDIAREENGVTYRQAGARYEVEVRA
jgi:hypothetical protein